MKRRQFIQTTFAAGAATVIPAGLAISAIDEIAFLEQMRKNALKAQKSLFLWDDPELRQKFANMFMWNHIYREPLCIPPNTIMEGHVNVVHNVCDWMLEHSLDFHLNRDDRQLVVITGSKDLPHKSRMWCLGNLRGFDFRTCDNSDEKKKLSQN